MIIKEFDEELTRNINKRISEKTRVESVAIMSDLVGKEIGFSRQGPDRYKGKRGAFATLTVINCSRVIDKLGGKDV